MASIDPASVEFTKINFLLENLYALYFRDMGVTHDRIPELSDELVRQAGLPGTRWGGEISEEDAQASQELLELRLAMFCAQVQERLRSAEED